ncbi:RHS domain-containing protein [Acinetobacter pittii]|nr:RHS domain-containing protein [Acinetobacter pittii]
MALNGEDVVSFERDDLHRETLRHYANGLSQQQRYDEVGRLTQQLMLNGHDKGYQAQTKNNAIQHTNQLIERLYHYDKTGELTLIKDTRRGGIHYKYDPVGRLLEATSKLGKETFNFDPASNILDRYNSTKEQSSQHTATEKGLGYNRLVNNIVQEYLDQQYQYDAFGQLIRQKSSQGDLNLEWDVLGRLVRSRNNQYTADYRYDALGRRIQKRSKHHHTVQEQNIIYGWDGDTLAYESSADLTKHYFYEKDSFVPLLQAAYHHSIELHQTQHWTEKTYSIYKDPLWNTVKQSQGFDDVWFYHCDHLGTPQEMSNQTGAIVWKAQYKAWGECKVEQAKSDFFENSEIISNNIRFQGQYFDEETGLHYNRYRYYSPYVGRFISKDPIGLFGGLNVYAYAPNPNNWVDQLGLTCSKYRRASLRDIRKKLGIPMSQQPIRQKMVPLTDKNGKRILNQNNMPIMTRELTYNVKGKEIVIQDHSAGHDFGEADGKDNQPSHHNVRPAEKTRTGTVDGMDDHFYFDCRNSK